MFKKVKSLLSLFICISVLCTVMPITSYAADAAENVASVTFDGNTEYYTTIDDAWNAAVALDTTAENKATIKLLADCTSNSMLNLVYDYFILDTNNKTLTGTSKLEYNNYVYSVIYVDGGSLEIIGNGTITGYTKSDYTKGILIVNNGVAYIDGVTVHNTGTGGAYGVVVRNGGDFYLLDGHIISDGEYALSAGTWDVYLYSGKIESSGRRAMTVRSRFHICYSDKPIYLINNDVKNKDMIIYSSEPIDYIMLLDDHVGVDLEYSQNPDGSNPISLKNVKKLSYTINHNTSYLKFQTFRQNTITVNATEGGTASSSSTDVRTGESVTLTATADEGYTFDSWYDGDTKVCDTAEFVVTNVTADKTYTAKFTKNQVVEPDPEPSGFDFTTIRTLKTKNVTVNHQTKTIDIDAVSDTEYVTILVHQKDVIPGGIFRMASYMGNKVVYDKNGSYRIYFVRNFTVPVKANITINGVSEQYLVNVNFDTSKANFDFTSLKGENFGNVTVNHDEKTIQITANDSADSIILNVNQHNTVYGGKLRMSSYLGNKVSYNSAAGLYTIYAAGKNSVSVKANITINGVTEQYLITVDFPGIVWGFDTIKAENVKNVSIDHENKVITIDTTESCDNILLYIDQICNSGIKGQIWMKSYMGNRVLYNASDRTYTITKRDKNSITVKTKITMLGETRYYDMIINFTNNN